MYLYDRNIMVATNLKCDDSSPNYYVIMMQQNLKKKSKKSTISNFLHTRGTKCRVEANNNREAVAVCARQVVKRPSKRSVLVLLKLDFSVYTCMCVCVYIYIFVCPELIEETVGRWNWFLAHTSILWVSRTSSSLRPNCELIMELWRHCHIFEGVKIH